MTNKSYLTWLVVLAGIAITTYAYYPGYMSPDSLYQYTQAISGTYSDWNPPVMSFVWSLILHVIPGPTGMVIFHNVLFWGGVGLLVSTLFGDSSIAWLLIWFVGFSPPVFALLGTVWKDVALGACLVFASAMFFRAQSRIKKNQRAANLYCAAGFFAVVYGLAARHNALAAVLPFAFWGAWILISANTLKYPSTRMLAATLIVGSVLLIGMIGSVAVMNNVLTKGKSTHPSQQIMLHDLVAISIATNRVVLPRYAISKHPGLTVAELKQSYVPEDLQPLFWAYAGRPGQLQFSSDDNDYRSLVSLWETEVWNHFSIYLLHRWHGFARMISGRYDYSPYENGITPNPFGFQMHRSFFNRCVMGWNGRVGKIFPFFFHTWFYLALLVLVSAIIVATNRKNLIAVCAVASSGALYTLAYFFMTTVPDFRMNWWTSCAALVVICFWLSEVYRLEMLSTVKPPVDH